MQDPTNVLTFDSITTIIAPTTGAWTEFNVNLSSYTGTGKYIAFKNVFANSIAYIDDIVIDQIPGCAQPTQLATINGIGQDVDITFTPSNPSSDIGWYVFYKPSSSADWDSVYDISIPITLSNLQLQTTYQIYVKTDCGDGTNSPASNAITYTTPCYASAISTFPWTEGFENGLSCWQQQNVIGSTLWRTTSGSGYNSAHIGTGWADFFYDDYGHRTKLISPILDISALSAPYLSFWHRQQEWAGDQDEMRVYYRASANDTWTQLLYYNSSIAAYRKDSIALPNPSSTYQIAFEGDGEYGRGVALDDIEVYDTITCPLPTNIVINNITMNSADITWDPGGEESLWQIRLGTTGTPLDVIYLQYPLTGLTPDSNYTIYVRANCGAGRYSVWISSTFSTLTAYQMPTVTTIQPTNITQTTATLNGLYVQGTEPILTKGFEWRLSSASTWNRDTVIAGTTPFSLPLNNLTANTHYHVKAFVVTATDGFTYGDSLQFATATPPTVTTTAVTNITQTTSTFNGTTSQGTEQIQARGFEYKPTSTSTWTGAIDVTASGTTTISANATGLTPSTQYDIRAYAQTASGRTYGNIENFITQGLSTPPTLTTNTVTGLTQTTATLNGTVVAGTETITAQGFEWKLAGASAWTTQNATGTNPSYQLTGLTANTAYQYRTFATTATNTYYGTTQNFTTLAIVPPTVTATAVTNITQTTAILNGNITAGTETITAQGFEWKAASETAWTTVSATLVSDAITYNLTGLTANTAYEYRAFAITASGTEYGLTQTFSTLAIVPPTVATDSPTSVAQTIATLNGTVTEGSEAITNQGFEWKLAGETAWTTVSATLVSGAITYNLTGLTANTAYNFKAYATTATGTVYGNIQNFTTVPEGITSPTVVTNPATSITQVAAILNGNITAGSEAITDQGFEWKLASGTTWTQVSESLVGNSITYNLTVLTANTAYNFKAYATTATGTVYGTTQNFTTLAIVPPAVLTNTATNITQTSADLNGTVTAGSEAIMDQGFEWKLASGTTWTQVSETLVGNSITYNLTGLTPSTNYEYRAFANTASGNTYGTIQPFTTDAIPVVLGEVTTQSATNIDTTHAVLNGNLVSVGNAISNIEVGFVYSTVSNPILGRTDVVIVNVPYVEGMTAYSSPIEELQHSTTYYVKAFINNSAGDAYGDEVTFITDSLPSGLRDIEADQFSVSIYPNPATNTTKLVVSGVEGETDIAINDIQGKLIYKTTAKAVNGKVEQTIDVNNFVRGVYYIRIQNQTTSRTQKLVVIY